MSADLSWDPVLRVKYGTGTKRARRRDGFVNEYLGIGTSRDKVAQGYFQRGPRLSDEELSAAFYQNDIARKIVAKLPGEAFRRGWELRGKGAEDLEQRAKDLAFESALLKAWVWGRQYGGAVMLIGADDGGLPWLPLDIERVSDIKFLNVLDRRRVLPWAFYNDPLAPKYGEPSIYQIMPDTFGRGPTTSGTENAPIALIHESRMIRFDGDGLIDLQERIRLQGWSYSVLQAPYRIVQQFATAFESAGFLLSDASQGVFKVNGLIDMIGSGEAETMQTRMMLVDMMRSALRSIVLDADGEEFTRVGTPLAGVADMLDRMMVRLAAAADMPVTILFGQAPAGLNATGESDTRAWYATVTEAQDKILRPAIERFYQILTGGAFDCEIEFCPLWEPSDKERAETEKTEAETDKILIDSGVVFAEQVALRRYADTPIEDTIDKDALEKALKGEYDLAAQGPPDPMDLAAAAGAPPGKPPGDPMPMKPPAPKADAIERPASPPQKPKPERWANMLATARELRELGMRVDWAGLAADHDLPVPEKEEK